MVSVWGKNSNLAQNSDWAKKIHSDWSVKGGGSLLGDSTVGQLTISFAQSQFLSSNHYFILPNR